MVELLAPAGNVEALDAAIGEGADAVYMGLKSFNARMRSSNFAWNQFEAAVQAVHKQKKKIFVTVNTVTEERELERLYRFLLYLDKIGPDGIIVQDFGIVRMAQEFFPNLRIHASTQMNCASSSAVNLMGKEGVSRVVLARELGLQEIKNIRAQTNVELEVFVHGALCVSESGLCLFSSYLGGKSANRGMCTQACRRFYEAQTDMGIKKGYYFSPYDLQLIEKIPDLISAGVDSFKIEGRMKSAEYVGSVTAAYRYVIDHWQEDKKSVIATAKRMLSTDFARAKTLYWYNATNDNDFDANTLLNPEQTGGTGIYLGKIDKIKTDYVKTVSQGNEDEYRFDEDEKFYQEENVASKVSSSDEKRIFAKLVGGNYEPEVGDSIRLHKKDDSGRESHKVKFVKDDFIDIPSGFSRGDEVYLLQTKSMSKRYPKVLPNDLSKYRTQVGAQILPIMDLTTLPKDTLKYFPEGIYIQVSSIKDFHTVLSEQPIRIILELNTETTKYLFEERQNIPVSKKTIFISLDPFCPQNTEERLVESLSFLVENDFSNFVVNNPAHIGMLKHIENKINVKKLNIIAGPYLYAFNRWAVSWLENQNIEAFIMNAENSRQNLLETFEPKYRKQVLIPVLAWPALFRMRFKLPDSYDFTSFVDKEGLEFTALSTPDGSYVMPFKPFSLIDKISALKKDGFSRFLLDFSRIHIQKGELKQIMRSLYKGEVLLDTSRFNWKDGFYNPEKIEVWKSATERGSNLQKTHNRKNDGKNKRKLQKKGRK
ncbi:MAG: U32 family peptidase [Treponema sp.]|nr:U32 family peptidase [Treponema sp.]